MEYSIIYHIFLYFLGKKLELKVWRVHFIDKSILDLKTFFKVLNGNFWGLKLWEKKFNISLFFYTSRFFNGANITSIGACMW